MICKMVCVYIEAILKEKQKQQSNLWVGKVLLYRLAFRVQKIRTVRDNSTKFRISHVYCSIKYCCSIRCFRFNGHSIYLFLRPFSHANNSLAMKTDQNAFL